METNNITTETINNEGQSINETVEETKTYTQAEVDKMLQSETDRRVTEALKKQARKNQDAIKEAEKLAKMNSEEKYAYELEQREQAIIAKERELALAENKNVASKILADKGISLDLVEFVIAEDAETMKTNIDTLERAFKKSVKSEVEKRLGTTTPKKNLTSSDELTKERFMKLSLREQQDILNTNPDLMKSLLG